MTIGLTIIITMIICYCYLVVISALSMVEAARLPPKRFPCPVCEGRGDCMLCDTPTTSDRTCMFLATTGAHFECAACGIKVMPSDIKLGAPVPCGMVPREIQASRP